MRIKYGPSDLKRTDSADLNTLMSWFSVHWALWEIKRGLRSDIFAFDHRIRAYKLSLRALNSLIVH